MVRSSSNPPARRLKAIFRPSGEYTASPMIALVAGTSYTRLRWVPSNLIE